jgi:integrase
MGSPWRIRTVLTGTGERLPLLLERGSGTPLFDPTVYALTEVRARNRAANTIQQHLVGIESLLLFCRAAGIDLTERIWSGDLLTVGELDGLARAVRRPIEALAADDKYSAAPTGSQRKRRNVVQIEAHRQGLRTRDELNVDPATAANRLRVIRTYLAWLTLRRLGRVAASTAEFARYDASRRLMLEALAARVPATHSGPRDREGLSQLAREWLEKVIEPDHPANPWKDDHVRQRNRLIVLLLYHLGLRRGELLALRVLDLDLRQCRLTIARRPDDPKDPRRQQPTAKTLSRVLPISSSLADMVSDYIIHLRRLLPGARKHGFLFVDTDRGRPLSAAALEKLFRELRQTSPELLRGLTAHVLRHTWNDMFSEIMDQRKVRTEDEEKQRSYLMGWRDGSSSATTYTRRHTRRRAQEASLAMQREAAELGKDNGH